MVSDMTQLVVTQIRSAIGAKPKQRGTLRALGPVSYTHLTLPTILLV